MHVEHAKLLDLIETVRTALHKSNEAMDKEEARNGYSDFIDQMIFEQQMMLMDGMLAILKMTDRKKEGK